MNTITCSQVQACTSLLWMSKQIDRIDRLVQGLLLQTDKT